MEKNTTTKPITKTNNYENTPYTIDFQLFDVYSPKKIAYHNQHFSNRKPKAVHTTELSFNDTIQSYL
jgi:vancomycin resistance protein YoaR